MSGVDTGAPAIPGRELGAASAVAQSSRISTPEPLQRTVDLLPSEATPLWFGPADRPLAGWLHIPGDRRVRAGVVLCPPIGIEAICAYYSYRVLASQLADHGFAVLRFDYDGTGDSAGNSSDPDRVTAWQASARQAVDLLAGIGVSRLALIGIRFGGLMAAYEARRREGTDALVLWDPCLTGTAFLRQEQTRYRLAIGSGPKRDDSVYGLGVCYDRSTAAELRSLSIAKLDGSLADRTLMLVDPERPPGGRLLEQLTGTITDWGEASGQRALLDPPRQTPPMETIDRITDWLSEVFGDSYPNLITVPTENRSALLPAPNGTAVTERFVELGPSGLFGILSEPSEPRPTPLIVFVNEGNTPHIGQSRMWVDLTRRWAAEGFRTLRWDLSGNGDSEPRPGQEPHVPGAVEAFQDIEEVLEAISPDDPSDVVLVGLCSGAYQSVEAALTVRPRGICLLNPVLALPVQDDGGDIRQAKSASRPWLLKIARRPVHWMAQRRSDQHVTRWTAALADAALVPALARRYPKVPDWTWTLLSWVCVANRSSHVLERVVRSGVDVLIVCNEEDLFPIRLGAARSMKRLQATVGFHLEVPPKLDHSILDMTARTHVMDLLTEHLLSSFTRKAPSEIGHRTDHPQFPDPGSD